MTKAGVSAARIGHVQTLSGESLVELAAEFRFDRSACKHPVPGAGAGTAEPGRVGYHVLEVERQRDEGQPGQCTRGARLGDEVVRPGVQGARGTGRPAGSVFGGVDLAGGDGDHLF